MSLIQMLINYVPGEECRVAVAEGGVLEEFHAERADAVSRVGNIYVGVVANVEPAIQAAFVDFGADQHGFLHISDLHPRYFPGEDDETTESVGKKTPRRDRPPIQACLRRGAEVVVQVLKEGVGTKGPTLTSYLSIPGRFLVMMPQMDRVGVSRKVEDEDQRRQMREILDQLDLPEGFGFILRTAGFDRNKTELKRDLAYLQRLWKDMERRQSTGRGPRLLYTESDLLVRALRDVLSPDTAEVIVDDDQALTRAARFLKIVAPRSHVRLLRYSGKTPLFHAYGIEPQIETIHAREVPLPSGGRLVIDQTEALVAIDVNSGKSRAARDAETNAYMTNIEAVEAICRQLRLRDLGGVVINDLIDMRLASHRKDIEARMKERLKRDRAKSTVAPISPFGVLEMTRQRMRGSQESVHFAGCPVCRGRGLVQKPDSVASDALRQLAALLAFDRVGRVELVVGARVAGELLSTRRAALGRIERASGKHVDVRVSEAAAIDRVTFYAYDQSGADIDLDKLPRPRKPTEVEQFVLAGPDDNWAVDTAEEAPPPEPDPAPEAPEAAPLHPIEIDEPLDGADAAGEPGQKKKRRRRRRRGRGRGDGEPAAEDHTQTDDADPNGTAEHAATADGGFAPEADAGSTEGPQGEPGDDQAGASGAPATQGADGGPRRRRRRRRRGRGRGPGPDGSQAVGGDGPETAVGFGPTAADPAENPAENPAADVAGFEQGDAPADGAELPDDDSIAEHGSIEPASGDDARDGPDVGQPGAESPDGPRRRRRRRRRGRGRGGDGEPRADGSPQPQTQAQAQAQTQPQEQVREQRQGRGSRGQPAGQGRSQRERPADRPADRRADRPADRRADRAPNGSQRGQRPPRDSRPPAPAPRPDPQPVTPAAPKPRLLYSSRRKLNPSEVARMPKE